MAKQKATHSGTCQVCGRSQKLPGGLLAAHGYTKRWGFFQGTCWGSHNLPWELDNSLVVKAKNRALGDIENLKDQMVEYKAKTDLKSIKMSHYESSYRFSGYIWIDVDVIKESHTYKDGNEDRVVHNYYYTYKDKKHPIHLYGYGEDKQFEALKAPWLAQLSKNIKNLEGYIKWQDERLATWVRAPEKLVEVKK